MADQRIERLIGGDPTEWILTSEEPYASWVALTRLQREPRDSESAVDVRAAVVADKGVAWIVDDLPAWGELDDVPGHHSPKFLPNQLNLLADMGVRAGDFEKLDTLLDGFLEHQDRDGRFESLGKSPGHPDPQWGSLLCDTNVITYVLMRYRLANSDAVERAVSRILKDSSKTQQGRAWGCIPQTTSRWRGPGRKADVCPQVTLEGLRVLSRMPADERPPWWLDAARTPLEIWRRRAEERPYMFGHGYQFKSVKWPNYWYDVLWVLETLCRFPELREGHDARTEDRIALAQMAACLVAYNFDDDGRVTPRRTYKGFERFSFGQKKEASPFATARALAALLPLADLADEIEAVDIESLGSSKGGTGTPRLPSGYEPCPVPITKNFPGEQAMPRVLARHHIGVPWVHASVDSIVADIVGLHATSQTGPYAALFTRLPGFKRDDLDRALYGRHSLVRWRSMRGTVFVVRRDLLPAIATATRRQVVKFAREYARYRGITDEVADKWAPRILEIAHDTPLTTAGYRKALGADADLDVATLVNLLATQGRLVRDRPPGGWRDRRWTYAATEDVFPEIRFDSMSEEDADADVTRAYLRAFGPATLKDASWWTGLGVKRVGRAVAALGDEVEMVSLTGSNEEFLMHSADVDELGAATFTERPAVAFLPSLDPLIMGFTDRSRYLDEQMRPFVFDRAGNSTNVILVDGRIAGVWDVTEEPSPRTLVHMLAKTDTMLDTILSERAASLGGFWFDRPAEVEFATEMTPLTERTAGSIMKPLR